MASAVARGGEDQLHNESSSFSDDTPVASTSYSNTFTLPSPHNHNSDNATPPPPKSKRKRTTTARRQRSSDGRTIPPRPLSDERPKTLMDVAFTATAYLNRHAEIHAAKAQKAAQALWEEGSRAFLQRHPESPPDQFAGRSVQVPEGPNGFTRAYRKLNQILMENRVRKMVKRQSRHEKKGVKRRRLASETHRRKFAQLVRSKVALVQRIRARGS